MDCLGMPRMTCIVVPHFVDKDFGVMATITAAKDAAQYHSCYTPQKRKFDVSSGSNFTSHVAFLS